MKTGSLHWPDHTKVGKHWTENRLRVWGRCPQLVICVSLVVICVSLVVTCVSSVFTDKIWNGLYYLFFFSVLAEHDVSDHTNIHQTNKITRQGRLGNHESRNDLISVRKPCHLSEGCHDGSTSTQNPSAWIYSVFSSACPSMEKHNSVHSLIWAFSSSSSSSSTFNCSL